MSETMTEERLGEIEARVADAPPGRPWTAGGDEDVPDLVREVRRLRGEIAERWEPQAKQWEERGNFWRGACAMIREQAAKVAAGAPEIARAILALPIHAGAFSAADAAAASRSYWPLFSLPLPGGASVEVETAERGYKVVRRGCDPWIAGTVPAPSILAAAVYVAQAVREIADTPRFVDGVKAAIEGGAAALGMLPIDDVRVGLPPGEATPLRFAIIPSGFGAAGGLGAVTELRPAPSALRCNVAGLCPHHAAGRPSADDCGPLALAWKTPEELGEQAARQLDRGAANVESVVADAVREDRTDILARLDDIHARTVAASGWSTRWQDFHAEVEALVADLRRGASHG